MFKWPGGPRKPFPEVVENTCSYILTSRIFQCSYRILYGSLWIFMVYSKAKRKKYNPIKVYSDDIFFFIFMRGLPMLPWLMIAIAHGFPKPPRLRPVRRRGTALGRQRGPRRGGGEADLGGDQGGSDHRRRRLGSWGHGAMGPWSHWDDNISSIIGNAFCWGKTCYCCQVVKHHFLQWPQFSI